jgi:hypothetical protein
MTLLDRYFACKVWLSSKIWKKIRRHRLVYSFMCIRCQWQDQLWSGFFFWRAVIIYATLCFLKLFIRKSVRGQCSGNRKGTTFRMWWESREGRNRNFSHLASNLPKTILDFWHFENFSKMFKNDFFKKFENSLR